MIAIVLLANLLFSPCLSELHRVRLDFINTHIRTDILFEQNPFFRMEEQVPVHVTDQIIAVLTLKKFTIYSKEKS